MTPMLRLFLLAILIPVTRYSYSQEKALGVLLSDTSMIHASVSLCIRDLDNGEIVSEYNPDKSLPPASIMKLITSGVALELLGPQYTFTTVLGYTGDLNIRKGRLSGNIVIRGGGDPALGSEYFGDHYQDFITNWISDIKKMGIKRVDGMIITDDSYYDFLPCPPKWLWEDIGNYYGAGVYGLSVFDNTCKIHVQSPSGSAPVKITSLDPGEYRYDFTNRLIASGDSDEGYVFAAPYSDHGWLSGTVPASQNDFILKGSIADPPLLIAVIMNEKLKAAGIKISKNPSTLRLEKTEAADNLKKISAISSPPLSEIIEVLNHESVNLYAETLLKELGKSFKNSGSTASGTDVIQEFLRSCNIVSDGMFIEDGSGLSPQNAISAEDLVSFLTYMKKSGKYFPEYYNSLPQAGKEGTLKSYFRDPVFEGRMRAKSGSMNRVRCYAGYITTISNRNLVFSIMINNYTGPSQKVISGIEEIIKEIILYK
jgi:serine-type D-Ala-D-Ala carboxypeptidase/endopeptidase (penicillin-binding protein 4)